MTESADALPAGCCVSVTYVTYVVYNFYWSTGAEFIKKSTSKMILLHWAAKKLGRPCTRVCSSNSSISEKTKFETVFTFPYIKYFALFNRLKVYHIYGSGVAVPSCGLLEMCDVLAAQSFTTAATIGGYYLQYLLKATFQ